MAALLLGFLPLPAADHAICTGVTEPVFDVMLSLSVPGIVTLEHFKEGSFVTSNQVILELDKRLEELEAARRKLVMENRKQDWITTKAVFEKTRSVSKDDLDKKEVEYQVAAVEYEMAAEQLRKRRLTAPGSGVITELLPDVGEACQPYQPLVRLVDIRQCYFVGNLEARHAGGLQLGQTVQLEIEGGAAPIKTAGRLVFLSPVVDPASGLQKVKVLFDNADGKIRPGLSAKMVF